MNLSKESLEYLIDLSEGDLRKSINQLQTISQRGAAEIKIEDIQEMCGLIPDSIIEEFMNTIMTGSYVEIKDFMDDFSANSYDERQLLDQLNNYILKMEGISIEDKDTLYELLMLTELRLLEQGSLGIHVMNLMVKMREVFQMKLN